VWKGSLNGVFRHCIAAGPKWIRATNRAYGCKWLSMLMHRVITRLQSKGWERGADEDILLRAHRILEGDHYDHFLRGMW
jgi:hypothetical protein